MLQSFGQAGVAEEGGGTDVLLQVPLATNPVKIKSSLCF